MNWVDVSIIISLVLAAFQGYKQGIIQTVVMFAGVIVGVALAGQLGGRVGEALGDVGAPGGSRLLGFAVVFGASVVAAFIIGRVARKAVHMLLLGWLDSLGGLAFGVLTSALVWSALVIAAGSTEIPWATSAVRDSQLGAQLADRGAVVLALLPEKYRSVLGWVGDTLPPEVTHAGVTATEVSRDRAKLQGKLLVRNPNRFGGVLEGVSYDFSWEQAGAWKVAKAGSKGRAPLSANDTHETVVELEVKRGDSSEAAQFLDALNANPRLIVRFKGIARVSFPAETIETPFQQDVALGVGQ
jgi:membrane protein required for colicin V production